MKSLEGTATEIADGIVERPKDVQTWISVRGWVERALRSEALAERERRSTYVATLDPETMTQAERLTVSLLADVFRFVESEGSCFDVLVRAAIEEGERTR